MLSKDCVTLIRYEDGSLEDDLICLVDACDKIGIYSQTHGMAIKLVGTVAGCGLKNYQFFHHIKSTVWN